MEVKGEVVMKKYVIEREIPKVGSLTPQQVKEAVRQYEARTGAK